MEANNKSKNVPKKCFCARCFLPIDESDKVEIDGQNFHKMCGTCCICRTIPAKLKMFYGHVFCEECFKTFVLARFRGENPPVNKTQVDSRWLQFAPGVKAQNIPEQDTKAQPEAKPATSKPEAEPSKSEAAPEPKKCTCARCLQPVSDAEKIEIGGLTLHCNCARCCSCHQVPKDNIKIYCGQVFCEECFNRLILSRSKDNPTEFYKTCFEQWKTNPQFAEHMKLFMESSSTGLHAPLVFMTPPPSYRCGAEREAGWTHSAESKSATPASTLEDAKPCRVDNKTNEASSDVSGATMVPASEKIEKLTKYLQGTKTEMPKKWKTIEEDSSLAPVEPVADWMKLQRPFSSTVSKLNCPKCLWQSGTIHVNRD